MGVDSAQPSKRLLVLGAGPAQLGLLEAARERGLFVIACDRNPAAPGFEYADRRAVVSVPISEERAKQPCLSDAEVSELAATGKHIERFHGSARDIEWALVEGSDSGAGELRILQSRRETVWSQHQREEPIFERKDSAVEYVLAELLGLGGGQPGEREKEA